MWWSTVTPWAATGPVVTMVTKQFISSSQCGNCHTLQHPIMSTFYRGSMETILSSCTTSCTLQRWVRAVSEVLGVSLPSLQDIYSTHLHLSIVGSPTHLSHSLFRLLPDWRTTSSIRPSGIWTLTPPPFLILCIVKWQTLTKYLNPSHMAGTSHFLLQIMPWWI